MASQTLCSESFNLSTSVDTLAQPHHACAGKARMALDGPVLDDGGEVVMSKLYPSQPKSAEATAMGAVGGAR